MSGHSGGVVVPPGQSPPFATITPNDHGAWIILSAAVGLSTTLVFSGIRIFIRQTVSPGYGADDWLLLGASIFVLIQSILVLVACADGLGKSEDLLQPAKVQIMQQLYYASNILYVIPLACSKAAVPAFLLRLTPVRLQRNVILGWIGFLILWAVALLFAVALSCDISHPWKIVNRTEQCSDYFLRWDVLEAIGCLWELAVYGSVVWLIWGLQTTRGNKTMVLVTFSFRLLLIVIAGLRLGSASSYDLTHDPTLRLAQFIAWTSAEMNYSVVSATMTILRPFVSNLATHYGIGQGGVSEGYGYGSASGSRQRSGLRTNATGRGTGLRSFTRSRQRESMELQDIEGRGGTKGVYSYGVATGGEPHNGGTLHPTSQLQREGKKSLDSNDSQRMIIRKDISFTVDGA